MRVDNQGLSFKIWNTIFVLAFLILIVTLIIFTALEALLLDIIGIIVCFLFYSLIFILVTIYTWGYYKIDENGITRCFLFLKQHYKWEDLQFIAKSRTYIRFSWAVCEKIVVSVKIPKEDFKRKHTYPMYSKKIFYMPYSKGLEEYIIAKAPIECYTYSYIIDDTTKKY